MRPAQKAPGLSGSRPPPHRKIAFSLALDAGSSEPLAGRLEVLTLSGFSLDEVGAGALLRHWRRGGFPPAYVARSERASFAWREQFVRTFLERELPQLGIAVPAAALHRFWTMLAHYHGGVWNASEAARSLGVSEPTARRGLQRAQRPDRDRRRHRFPGGAPRRLGSPAVILLDTHVLVWLAGDAGRLSRPAATAIRRALASGGLAVASITLWELAMLFARGRLRGQGTFETSIRAIVDGTGVAVREITPDVAALATQFPPEFPADPADRLIAATARAEGLALVTSNERIQASPLVKTIW